MTPSESLRRASETLRARADLDWNLDDGRLWITDYDPSDPTGQTAMQRVVGGADEPWASFIALMDPTLAGLVADWLEAVADAWAGTVCEDQLPPHALALAEHINGRNDG